MVIDELSYMNYCVIYKLTNLDELIFNLLIFTMKLIISLKSNNVP